MNEYYYAQIDVNDVVTAVTQTAGPIDSPNMIRIDGLLPVGGKKYDRVASKKTPTFVDIPQAPTKVQSVTMRQARLALLAIGKLQDVSAAINSMPSPQKEQAQIEWEFAATVDRNSTLFQSLASSLGLTDVQIDTLFTEASKL